MDPEYSVALEDAFSFFKERGGPVNFLVDFEKGEDFDIYAVYDEEDFPSTIDEKDAEFEGLLGEIGPFPEASSSVYYGEGNRVEYRIGFSQGTLNIVLTSDLPDEGFIEIEEIGAVSGF